MYLSQGFSVESFMPPRLTKSGDQKQESDRISARLQSLDCHEVRAAPLDAQVVEHRMAQLRADLKGLRLNARESRVLITRLTASLGAWHMVCRAVNDAKESFQQIVGEGVKENDWSTISNGAPRADIEGGKEIKIEKA
ncbi:hypothetical protein SCUP234_11875 [Seiridium cupressi]